MNGESFQEDLESVVHFYKEDINEQKIVIQLELLRDEFKERQRVNDLSKIVDFFKEQTAPMQLFFSEVLKLTQLLLVMPATNAVSERTFSAMRVIKNYMRTNSTQQRLNNTMLLYINKDRTDRLDILTVATKFVNNSAYRKQVFGTFSPLDIETTLVSSKSKATQTN